MCSVVSIVECPSCGGFVLVSDLGVANGPTLKIITCELCDKKLHVKYNEETREIVVEEAKMA